MNTNTSVEVHLDMDLEGAHFYREPPPPYNPNPVPVTHNAVAVTRTIIVQPPLKNSSMPYLCPTCHSSIVTTVKLEHTKKTHMLAGFIFGFTCWCCLCCLAGIPYLFPKLKKAHHYCPRCSGFLGSYE